MNPFSHLSDENDDQLRKYLRFFRSKKDGIIRSIKKEINEIKVDKLNEEVYTKDDVSEIVDFISSGVQVLLN